MPLTPQDFVSKWKRVTAREKQTYQEHFIDLRHLVGHQTPNDYDPADTRFAFEMGVAKTSGAIVSVGRVVEDNYIPALLRHKDVSVICFYRLRMWRLRMPIC